MSTENTKKNADQAQPNADQAQPDDKSHEIGKDETQYVDEPSDSLSMDAFEFIGRMANNRTNENEKDKPRK